MIVVIVIVVIVIVVIVVRIRTSAGFIGPLQGKITVISSLRRQVQCPQPTRAGAQEGHGEGKEEHAQCGTHRAKYRPQRIAGKECSLRPSERTVSIDSPHVPI